MLFEDGISKEVYENEITKLKSIFENTSQEMKKYARDCAIEKAVQSLVELSKKRKGKIYEQDFEIIQRIAHGVVCIEIATGFLCT